MDLRTAARMLGGEVSGRGILCPGPAHSPRDRSLSVLFSPSAPGGFLCRSYSGDDWSAAKDHVRERLGLDGAPFESHRRIGPAAPRPCNALKSEAVSDTGRTARALRIWEQGRHPSESPVERYLARRGLDLPDDPREVIRFAPSCPFAGCRTRAMVALVRNVVTNEPQAVHRTALDLAGHKIEVDGKDRLALGPIAGGAIKLSADETVTTCLGIAEGLETTLSLQRLPEFGLSAVWSLISASGIESFPVLAGIECLWIAVDRDAAGIRASHACAARWREAGREVFLVSPTAAGADLNDILEARHG